MMLLSGEKGRGKQNDLPGGEVGGNARGVSGRVLGNYYQGGVEFDESAHESILAQPCSSIKRDLRPR